MKNKYHIFFTGMLSIAFFMGATVDTKAQDSIAVVSRVNIEHLKLSLIHISEPTRH